MCSEQVLMSVSLCTWMPHVVFNRKSRWAQLKKLIPKDVRLKLTCVLIMILHFHPHPSSIPTLQELRDRNDELSSELELLKSQRNDRKSRPSVDTTVLSWAQDSDSGNTKIQHTKTKLHTWHLKSQVYGRWFLGSPKHCDIFGSGPTLHKYSLSADSLMVSEI